MPHDTPDVAANNAFSHPRRLRLLRLLALAPEDGMRLAQLQAATGYAEAPLGHHLRVLERSGLVTRRAIDGSVSLMLSAGAAAPPRRGVAPARVRRRAA